MRNHSDPVAIAELVRRACIDAARNGFADASIDGLCEDGAIEAAISAIQKLDLPSLILSDSGACSS
jgi:hypothetical protein